MIKVKLIGGPFHARRYFFDSNLPKVVFFQNGEHSGHYAFSEMRALNYFTYNYISDEIAVVQVNGTNAEVLV